MGECVLRWLLVLVSQALVGGAVWAQVVEPASQLSGTRTVVYERDALTGAVTAEVSEPSSAQHCLRKVYGRDGFGNLLSTTVQNCAGAGTAGTSVITSRTELQTHSSAGDNPAGLYPNTQVNALGHEQQLQHHNAFGLAARVQDANGLVTQHQYDSFGRKLRVTHPDGNLTQWRYDYCTGQGVGSGTIAPPDPGPCPSGAALRVYEVPTSAAGAINGPLRVTYLDAQEREIQTRVRQFATVGNPRWSIVTTEYDALGRVSGKTEPHFDGESPALTSFVHDALGRVTQEFKPHPYAQSGVATRTHEYGPRRVVSTNPRGYTQTREFDEFDRTIRLTDAKGGEQSYQFTAWGHPPRERDPEPAGVCGLQTGVTVSVASNSAFKPAPNPPRPKRIATSTLSVDRSAMR